MTVDVIRLRPQTIIARDFLVAMTATFRPLYVLVVIEHRSRRFIHCNITAHPSATWTLQQVRENITVRANAVLGGLHHEHFLAPTAAQLSICE